MFLTSFPPGDQPKYIFLFKLTTSCSWGVAHILWNCSTRSCMLSSKSRTLEALISSLALRLCRCEGVLFFSLTKIYDKNSLRCYDDKLSCHFHTPSRLYTNQFPIMKNYLMISPISGVSLRVLNILPLPV